MGKPTRIENLAVVIQAWFEAGDNRARIAAGEPGYFESDGKGYEITRDDFQASIEVRHRFGDVVRYCIVVRHHARDNPLFKNSVIERASMLDFTAHARQYAGFVGPPRMHAFNYTRAVARSRFCFFCSCGAGGYAASCDYVKKHEATHRHKKNAAEFIDECAAGWRINADCVRQVLSYLKI